MVFELKRADKYIAVIGLMLFGLVAINFLRSYTGLVYYPRQGFIDGSSIGGFLPGFGGLIELYYSYSQWFDFFLFLIIFLGLGQIAFGRHFKEGGKAVYVGLGIFLSLALVIWEAKTGIILLEFFGPLAAVFLVILALFLMFKYLKGNVNSSSVMWISLAYIGFYILFIWLDTWGFMTGYYSNWVYYNIPIDLIPIATLFFFIAIIATIFGFLTRKK